MSPYIHPGLQDAATCEACGAAFMCGVRDSSGCWCADVKLSEAVRAELRTRYERCLCRACLAQFSEVGKEAAG